MNFFLLCLQIWPSVRGRKENLFQFRNAGSIGNRGEDHHNYFYIRQFLRIVLILVSSRVHEVFSAERICGRHVIQTQTGKPLNFYCLVLVHWACDACPKKKTPAFSRLQNQKTGLNISSNDRRCFESPPSPTALIPAALARENGCRTCDSANFSCARERKQPRHAPICAISETILDRSTCSETSVVRSRSVGELIGATLVSTQQPEAQPTLASIRRWKKLRRQ